MHPIIISFCNSDSWIISFPRVLIYSPVATVHPIRPAVEERPWLRGPIIPGSRPTSDSITLLVAKTGIRITTESWDREHEITGR